MKKYKQNERQLERTLRVISQEIHAICRQDKNLCPDGLDLLADLEKDLDTIQSNYRLRLAKMIDYYDKKLMRLYNQL